MLKIIVLISSLFTFTCFAKEVTWGAFSQLTIESGEGTNSSTPEGRNFKFGADRVRIFSKYKLKKFGAKIQLDFLKSGDTDDSKHADFTEVVKDAFLTYKNNSFLNVKFGIFKTPLGMDFNTSGTKLDITKRGSLTKNLILERAPGLMLSGEVIGGFSYDLGIFDPAARSSSVGTGGERGSRNAYASRLKFDHNKFHGELAYGTSQDVQNNLSGEDYQVIDFAFSYKLKNITLKAEVVDGKSRSGTDRNDQTAWYLHTGYKFSDKLEAVARHYMAKAEKASTPSDTTLQKAELSNTYIGLNYWPEKGHRLQLNYVLVGGDHRDTKESANNFKWSSVGTGGYTANAILTQWQFSF